MGSVKLGITKMVSYAISVSFPLNCLQLCSPRYPGINSLSVPDRFEFHFDIFPEVFHTVRMSPG